EIQQREERRDAGISRQQAESLGQLEERPAVTDGAAFDALEQRTLLPLILGSVAGGDCRQSLDQAAAAAHLGFGILDTLHGLVVEAEVVAGLVDDRVAD